MPYVSPETLLRRLGVREPRDIDVEAIAFDQGAVIEYEPLRGCEARILGEGDRAFISIRDDVSRERQRFSASHEIAHWMLDRGRGFELCSQEDLSTWRDGSGLRRRERRANRYAAELLMPSFLFSPDVQGRDITIETTFELAQHYKTSRTATAIRLIELGSYPAMVACFDVATRERRWWIRGPDVPEDLWPVRMLQRGSVAFDLTTGKALSSHSGLDVETNLWFDRPGTNRYPIRESSFMVRDQIISLLWWKDEQFLIDITTASSPW